MKTIKQRRRLKPCIRLLVFSGLSAVIVSNICIDQAARKRTFSDVTLIPSRHAGLVLGCSQYIAGGQRNLFFINRVSAAAELFHAGKVSCLIVSGDNHAAGYDEPTDMKCALVAAGVPENKIHCDYAGFRTLDSVVRSKEIFNQTQITIISQPFHNRRAIYIARRKGIDAIGFNADNVNARYSLPTLLREQLAKIKAVIDLSVLRTRPRFLGPKIAI